MREISELPAIEALKCLSIDMLAADQRCKDKEFCQYCGFSGCEFGWTPKDIADIAERTSKVIDGLLIAVGKIHQITTTNEQEENTMTLREYAEMHKEEIEAMNTTTACECRTTEKRTLLDTLTVTVPLSLYHDLVTRCAKAEADYSAMCSVNYELRQKLRKLQEAEQ